MADLSEVFSLFREEYLSLKLGIYLSLSYLSYSLLACLNVWSIKYLQPDSLHFYNSTNSFFLLAALSWSLTFDFVAAKFAEAL